MEFKIWYCTFQESSIKCINKFLLAYIYLYSLKEDNQLPFCYIDKIMKTAELNLTLQPRFYEVERSWRRIKNAFDIINVNENTYVNLDSN